MVRPQHSFSKDILVLALTFLVSLILGFSASQVFAAQISLKSGMAQKYMTLGKSKTAYLHINLQGIALPDDEERAPVNVAIVIDKSGSMTGRKLQQAKRAAIMALGLLDSSDTISIVAYSDRVDVLVPATRLRNRAMIERRIEQLFAGGSTALYAGVKEGGEQLESYLDREHVNRLILLSDGLANVGPKSPDELADLTISFYSPGHRLPGPGLHTRGNSQFPVCIFQ